MRKPTLKEVQSASHEQLARWWRFLPIGALQNGDKVTEELKQRLFKEHDGITTEISKRIGWEK